MQYSRFLIFFLMLAVFMTAGPHEAAASPKLGDLIKNMTLSWGQFHNIASIIAWIAGSFLGCAAIFKFKDHVDNPAQTPLSAGVKRILAGGAFLSLPWGTQAVVGNLYGKGYAAGTGKVDDTGYNVAWGSLTPGGLDEMVVNVMRSVGHPLENMCTAFAYLAGIALLVVGISRLTKRMEEGPRGPAGFGTIMTFVASGMLLNYGASVGSFTGSMFGDESLMTRIDVANTVIANATDQQRVETVLSALEVFVMIVGYIAFIRGWFVMKNFADGQQGATLAQGLTFLIGGAIAVNLGEFINAVTTTVNVTGLTFS